MSDEQPPFSTLAPDEYELQEPLARTCELPATLAALHVAASQTPSEAVVIHVQPTEQTYPPISTVARGAAQRNEDECDENMKTICAVVGLVVSVVYCLDQWVCVVPYVYWSTAGR